MDVLARNNVTVSGLPDGPPMLFAHGFGCDQNMWRHVAPAFEATHRVILFDHVGAGGSDLHSFDPVRHADLAGYADDVLDICEALDLTEVVFVGHSVSSMIGVLAANRRPELFSRLVLVGPSPRYINEGDYVGGFTDEDIAGLLDSLDSNYLGWSSSMAPVIMGTPDRPDLEQELTNSFCRTDPDIARHFARVTFLSDHRADLPKLQAPALILQCSDDLIAPRSVGEYMQRVMPQATLRIIENHGHCPHMSAPQASARAM
ncbi:MAG TPA: alpha/beta hydrolase, partial [Actinomycetes bacterium]